MPMPGWTMMLQCELRCMHQWLHMARIHREQQQPREWQCKEEEAEEAEVGAEEEEQEEEEARRHR